MNSPPPRVVVVPNAVYAALEPLPFGFFAAALIFDAIYVRTANVMWTKGAAWLIAFGLLIAVIPRLVNLFEVWSRPGRADRADRLAFWLNAAAIVVAILNAFVHSRDAYAVVPAGLWLSIATVVLIAVARGVLASRPLGEGVQA